MNLESCFTIRLEDPNIVLLNECNNQVYVEHVVVGYYVTSFPGEPTTTPEHYHALRRRIEEKIRVGKTLPSRSRVEIYFGPVANISEILVIAGFSKDDLRRFKAVIKHG